MVVRKSLILMLVILLTFTFCRDGRINKCDLLILNANILDVERGIVDYGKFIVITNDTIRLVDDMLDLVKFEALNTINAGNKYVMPGLWDNHVHFRGGDSLIAENKDLLPLFLAYGITTVVDAGGDITPAVLSWKDKVQKDSLDGPEILSSGPKLDGEEPMWEGSIKIGDVQDVNRALDSLQNLRVDYIKIYDGSLTEEMYYAIIQESETRGLKTTGHIPLSANLLCAIEKGLDGAQHLDYMIKATSLAGDSLSKLDIGYLEKLELMLESHDSILAQSLFRTLGDQKFNFTPTAYIGDVLKDITTADHSKDSLLSFIGAGIQATYQERIIYFKNLPEEVLKLYRSFENQTHNMIKPLHQSGVNIIAGSDCGPFNSYIYPGESLLKELITLANVGLSNREALASSIINGPEFFGLRDYYGSIGPRKVANLIILAENPLENIKNITSLETVIRGDKIYDQDKIRGLLTSIKRK